MSGIWTEPISDESAWRGSDFVEDRSWEYVLDEGHVAELDRALQEVKRRGLKLGEIGRGDFPLPTLGELLARLQRDLCEGRGFALMRGFPVEEYELEDVEKLYWGLCTHLGIGITQNSQAGLIHYVTDGRLRPQQGTRGVGNPAANLLHIDLTDCVSLLCVRQAPGDPPSWLGSSMTVYNEVLRQRPGDLQRLYDGFVWDRKGEEAGGETPTTGYQVPLFSQANGKVSCRYNRNWICTGLERLGQSLSEEETELLDFIDHVAYENRFEFPLLC